MKKVLLRFFGGPFILLLVAGLGACATARSAPEGDLVTLQNGVLSLTLKKTPAPYISRLVSLSTGTALVSNSPERGFFAILFAKSDGQDYIDSSFARTSVVSLTRIESGTVVDISYSGFPNLDLSVHVRGTFSNQESLTLWTIDVHNRTGRRIDHVRFPLLRAVPALGNADDDFLVFPIGPGVLIRNPRKNWPVDFGPWPRSPGPLSAQFVAYQDSTAGIYLASQDGSGYEKQLSIWKKDDGFGICHDYVLLSDAGVDWKSPYPVALGVTKGTWCDSADLYKAWATRQSWCARTLSQRSDVPEWLKRGPLIYISSMRTYDGKGNQAGSFYGRLLPALQYLQSRVGGPIVAMLADWENHRRWTGGDCFPVFDERNAQKVIQQIKGEGFRPFFFLSGLNYTFENEGPSPSKISVPAPLFSQFVLDEKTGMPQVFTLEESFFSSAWRRRSYAFCVGGPGTRAFFRGMIDQAMKLGVSVLQMDQTVDGAGPPCYSRQHGHVPGIGPYQTQEFQALLQDMRACGKARDSEFALFHEEPHEQLIPCLDGFHIREYIEGQWYRGFPGSVGIPLFSYLYHEYAIGYGGDSARIGPRGVDPSWMIRSHAVNLVTGKTPAAATWMFPDELSNAEPRALGMIRSHLRLLSGGGSSYLLEGRMLHPLQVSAPTLTYTTALYDAGKARPFEFTESSVLTSSWQAPDGRVGHVFVNLSPEKLAMDVDIDTRNVPASGLYDASVFRSTVENGFVPLWRAVRLPRRLAAVLSPDEVLFLELSPAGK